MVHVIAFILLSIPITAISWKSLKNRKTHGFFRFICWEAMLVLLIFNLEYWFYRPFSIHQIISWSFFFLSLILVLTGMITLKKKGKQGKSRNQNDLYAFEKTSELVETGIFRYIRHPMYSSLLFLTWGIYLKNPDLILLNVAVLSSLFLFLTARADENECIGYFGEAYRAYMKKTTRFIPFLL